MQDENIVNLFNNQGPLAKRYTSSTPRKPSPLTGELQADFKSFQSTGKSYIKRFTKARASEDRVMSTPSREEYDAKLSAVESRLEASLARMEGKIASLPTSSDLKSVRGNIWGAAAAVIATVIGIFSLWAVGFDSGIQITSTSVENALDAKTVSEQNSDEIKALGQKIDAVIEAITQGSGQGSGQAPGNGG